MAADAASDGILAIVCLALALVHQRYNRGLALAYLLVMAAAFVGCLRYSLSPALTPLHEFFALIATVSALPLLASSLLWQERYLAHTWRSPLLFFIASSAIGIIAIVMLQFEWWRDLCSLVALVILACYAWQQRELLNIIGLFFVIAAFLIISLQLQAGLFSTVQLLHYSLALGFINFSVALTRVRALHPVGA